MTETVQFTQDCRNQGIAKVCNDSSTNTPRPVGYLRAKVFSRNILTKVLIDSGNLFGDLVSEQFAKLLSLKIQGTPRNVGTASANGSVTILGRTSPIKLYFEGLPQPVTIEPYVVKELAHPINLGQAFLRRHDADIYFRNVGVQLRLKTGSVLLQASNVSLVKSSIDARIKMVLDKFKLEGKNPFSEQDEILDLRLNHVDTDKLPGVFYKDQKKQIILADQHLNVYSKNRFKLEPQTNTVVTLTIGKNSPNPLLCAKESNDVYLQPMVNNKLLNTREIFIHPGLYHRTKDTVSVLVANLSHKTQILPKGTKIGHIAETAEHVKCDINSLSHKPVSELTAKEKLEREEYIKQGLKLEENELLADKPQLRQQIINMFLENFDSISIDEYDFGNTRAMQFHIDIPPGTTPVRAKLRPLNPSQEMDLKRQIDAWLEAKVIEPSHSAWASALVACKKKGSDHYRWAIDYRAVNALTTKDAFPLANIESNLHKLSGAQYFSTLDSAGAFHCIPILPEHRDYTSFVSPMGHYRFIKLPFGLANAPAAYSRLVSMALQNLPTGFAMAYIDDIIVYSASLEEHISHLQQIVELHCKYGMKLNLRKCKILQSEVEYLGHLVCKDGIKMVPSYVQKIIEWPTPASPRELRSFLGFSGYYRVFIKEFSYLTADMQKIKNGQILTWTPDLEQKFVQLKEAFNSAPLRGFPQYSNPEPFILDTDWSHINMACVLSQRQNGREVFLGCAARKCSKAESNYPSHKGELAAVVYGLKKFEHILRAKKFVIRTDSRCVQFLNGIKEHRGMFARWSVFLTSFNFDLVHRPGTKQVNADSLSRREDLKPDPELDEVDKNEPLHDVDDIYVVDQEAIAEISQAKLKQETSCDPVLSKLIPFLEKGTKPNKEERKSFFSEGIVYVNYFECLSLTDGVIYFTGPTLNGKEADKRICLPFSLQASAFRMCHADPANTSGHMGVQSTYAKMKSRFFFPHMLTYCNCLIQNCVNCIKKQPNYDKSRIMHRETSSYFGQRVYSDIVGPLSPSTHNGKMCRHILTIQDGFTRYLQCIPVPDITTETVATAIINNWVLTFGLFETLHTDRGTQFTSHLFHEIMTRLGIVKTFTPSYSPDANKVERAHRVLGDLLRADNRFSERNWTAKLPVACLAYNANINRITGQSPFEAVFGRKIILPVDLVFPTKFHQDHSWSEQVECFKIRLHEMFDRMLTKQQSSFAIAAKNYQGRSKPEIKVNDTVFYFVTQLSTNVSKKLTTRWIGPFEVQKVVSDSLVIIYPKGDWAQNKRQMATIVNRLKKIEPEFLVQNAPVKDKIDLDCIPVDTEDVLEQITSDGFVAQFPKHRVVPPHLIVDDNEQAGPGLTPAVQPPPQPLLPAMQNDFRNDEIAPPVQIQADLPILPHAPEAQLQPDVQGGRPARAAAERARQGIAEYFRSRRGRRR